MADSPEPSRSDADEEIMQATYRALREHGYADLTMQRIAAEYGKTTAAIHYHFDTKDDLLVAFLDYLLDRFQAAARDVDTDDPRERLDALLDNLLVVPQDHHDLLVAMLEMRSQAPYTDAFSERFQQNDSSIRRMLVDVLLDGIEAGAFRDVDPDHAARALMTVVDGGRTRAVVHGDTDALAAARRTAAEYVAAVLIADDAED